MLKSLAAKLFGTNRDSKKLAKSRLHFVLVQDRTGLSNEQMAKFRGELVEVIQRYFVIDEQGFDIAYERQDDSTTLVINSPVVVKRQESHGGIIGSERGSSERKVTASRASSSSSAGSEASDQPRSSEQRSSEQQRGARRGSFRPSKGSSRRARRAKGKPASANA